MPRSFPTLVAFTAVALVFAATSTAKAAPLIGIAENQPAMFDDPNFKRLKVKRTRLVVSYNAISKKDGEIDRVQRYLDAARKAGIEVLVTFEHSRGAAEVCKRNRSKPQCRLPTDAQYKSNLTRFLKRFPQVRLIAPWNEMNHFTQPTAKNPEAAARFVNIARQVCRNCKIVAADLLDQADRVGAKNPTFKSAARWIKRFRARLRVPRTYCGLHNYSDTNRLREGGTKFFTKALGCRQIWLTETGGIYRFAGFGPSEARQERATRFVFRLARKYRQIKRVYIYNWFSQGGRFDAGLVARGKPRKAYFVVQSLLGVSGDIRAEAGYEYQEAALARAAAEAAAAG